jgi:hypothetical protein
MTRTTAGCFDYFSFGHYRHVDGMSWDFTSISNYAQALAGHAT